MALGDDDICRQFLGGGRREASTDLADAVRRMMRGPHDPHLALQFGALLGESDGSVFRLLDILGDRAEGNLGLAYWFPYDVFCGPYRTSRDLEFPIADVHMHSGAALSAVQFVDMLACSEAEISERAFHAVGTDLSGERYCVGVIISALRSALHWLMLGAGHISTYVKPVVSEALANGSFWSRVGELARDPELLHSASLRKFEAPEFGDNEFLSELTGGVNGVTPDSRANDLLVEFVTRAGRLGTRIERSNAVGLVVAVTLANGYLRSYPGEGLPRFVDRFDEMSLARDVFIARSRRTIVADSCHNVASSPAVLGVEFRKSIFVDVSDNASDLEESVARSLGAHLGGFLDFCSQEGERSLYMPLGFVRQSTRGAQSGELEGIADYDALWKAARAIEAVLSQDSSFSGHVGRIDLAGDETQVGNFAYLPAFDFLRGASATSSLAMSVHAGESFRWRMQGLRSIGEAVAWPGGLASIGHGLALNATVSEFVCSARPSMVSARELLDDLCFLECRYPGKASLEDALDRVLSLPGVGSCVGDVDNCLEAWRTRGSLTGLQSIGLVAEDPRSSVCDLSSYPSDDLFRLSGGLRRSVVALMFRGVVLEALDRFVTPELAELCLGVVGGFEDAVEQELIAECADREVAIEVCATSNQRLTGLPSMRLHPISSWLDHPLKICAGSDDPLIFGCDIVTEFDALSSVLSLELVERVAGWSLELCGGPGHPSLDSADRLASLGQLPADFVSPMSTY